ncbi:two-component regulator propeller domain-containing protein [Flammeovirga kamogawensis]|uniref:histidine kinase n=1 Tax=Flammeovirga kamogawensis TaxID=373891 RepID=A0ABX8H0Y9_9BACT|nr:two-component regulator propeller domain-containing protein [Flammeovirga kamogawensis]MBB6463294.1 signal transduction histidine kinase/ligand-binding sensor domain-containing protein/CheY-like chemotaxis protein [Flammeovirga kamogawensis]QWG09556.1 response regulator [Flammeovirga kamogawensis]TRX65070.1 response regulator [Flammeovirga kamogawensis]
MKFFNYLCSIFSIFITFTASFSNGQNSPKFEYLNINEGLNHSWAKCLAKDNKGYLWIGGISGLNRYNGSSFKNYSGNETDKSGLSDHFILSIYEDSKNNFWVGTFSGGLNLLNRQTDTFKTYRNQPKNTSSLPNDKIQSIFEDADHRLWIGTGKGLVQYDYETDGFIPYTYNKNGKTQSIKDPIRCIYEDKSNTLWVGTDNGLYQIQIENKYIKHYKKELNTNLSHNTITSVYEDEFNQFWVGTLGGGLNLLDKETGLFKTFTLDEGIKHNSILCLNGNQNGQLYIGTEGGGLHILDTKTYQIIDLLPDDSIPNSINSNSIHSLLYDNKGGILWVGTYNGGVNYFSKWDKDFNHLKKGILSSNNVLSFAEGPNKEIYVGTDGGGITILKDGKSSVLSKKDGLSGDVILSMLTDKEKNLWVGSFNGGLDFIDYKTGKIKHFYHKEDDPTSLSRNDVSSIFQRKNGDLWVGTMHGGLNKLNTTTASFTHYRSDVGNPKSISNDFIGKVFEDSRGNLLVQTGSSIDIYNDATDDFTPIGLQYKINISTTVCSYEDQRGNLWIGTRNKLIYLDRSSDISYTYTTEDGLPSNSISGILDDEQGNLWISTQRGLVKYINAVHTPNKADFHVFTVEDGLQGLDFKIQAAFQKSDGTMYFGGNNGLNYFKPKDIWLNPVQAKTVISSFRLFNKEVEFGTENSPLPLPIDELNEITLSHDQNIFSFEFSALNFILPKKNQYAYMLEGLEDEWYYVNDRKNAYYNNLKPGIYTFKVKASNNDGIWNTQPTALKITVIPPWWETTLFRVLFIISIIIGLLVLYKLRVHQLKEQKKKLTAKVNQATSTIKEVNELLAQQNHDLNDKNSLLKEQNHELETQSENINNLLQEVQENNEAKLRFFTNISHELRTPLTLIIGPLKQLIQGESKSPKDDYDVMFRNANSLLKNVNQLLDFRKLESGNIHLKASENDIVSFSKARFLSFSHLAQKKKIDFHFESFEKEYIMWFDAEKMDNIVTNLLSNAFKYTPDHRSIHFSIKKENNEVLLEIKDTGLGISKEQKAHIFDLYYQANNSVNSTTIGTGIGLALIKQFVDLHHGTIDVISEQDKGSTFTVRLKTGEDFLSSTEKTINHTLKKGTLNEDIEQLSFVNESTIDVINDDEIQEIKAENLTILIVEDNNDIRKYIKENLRNVFNIIEAENGKIGLEKVMEYSPDFVISDIMMPELNGPDLCKLIKNEPQTSHIPVILLTAYSGEETQWNGYSAGADDYIVKPFDINILRRKISNMAATRKMLVQKFQSTTSYATLNKEVVEDDFLGKAIEVVKDNMDNFTFGVDDFTEHFGMSKRHLLRKMKSISGLSINEFIKNIRLKYAADLMKDPELNISDIAYQTGFNDPKYFSKCFKLEFKKTPSEYREEIIMAK